MLSFDFNGLAERASLKLEYIKGIVLVRVDGSYSVNVTS